jgi:Domain of unknown function (DUF5916)/Carbohydrate family 9 binding domain-like
MHSNKTLSTTAGSWLILTALAIAVPAYAQEFTPKFSPTIAISRATGPIKIDGELDESAWKDAAAADGFAETNPGDQIRPPVESKAMIAYDDENLYVALIAYDDPSSIRYSLRDRDNIFSDDYFGIMLDTYGDGSSGYEFFVNPLGIQGDLRMDEGGGEDESFDAVWHSEGKITLTGYQVEIAIPFKSLRFSNKDEQVWKVNFWRDRQRDTRYKFAWAAQDRNNNCFICQWGTLTGIKGIKPGRNLEFFPTIVTYGSGEWHEIPDSTQLPDNGWQFGRHLERADINPDAELSFNGRYSVSSNITAEVAVNPDFSQVESDALQITSNDPFNIFLDERRPFFQEGSELFNNMPVAVMYTRQITNPSFAGKLSGKFGKTAFTVLSAADDYSASVIPGKSRSRVIATGKAYTNMARVKVALSGRSHIGGIIADRRYDGGGSGTTYGFDSRLRFLENYSLRFAAFGSHTLEKESDSLESIINGFVSTDTAFDHGRHTYGLNGERFDGHIVDASLNHSSRHVEASLYYREVTPTFRTESGFLRRNDNQQASFWAGWNVRPKSKFLIYMQPQFQYFRNWSYDGSFMDAAWDPQLYIEFGGQTSVYTDLFICREKFLDSTFEGILRSFIEINTRPLEWLGASLSFNRGDFIYRSFDSPPVLAKGHDFGFGLNLKLTRQLSFSPDYSYQKRINNNTNERLFSEYAINARSEYQFSREWFMRLVLRYGGGSRDVSIEPLLSYKMNPFTIFYLGAAHRRVDLNMGTDYSPSSYYLFAKFQYLFKV